jgi:hypothetical protein
MKSGHLSQYFEAVAAKRLSAVEADETRSNQHEYNATKAILAFMGRPAEPTNFPARFIYLSDSADEPVIADAFLTLYDSRKGQPHRSAEYRFYFPTTNVSLCATEGDLLVIGKLRDSKLLVIIAEGGSTIDNQIRWLFGFSNLDEPGFSVKGEAESDQVKLEYTSRLILEQVGVEVEERDENYLDMLLKQFGGNFPTTREFSIFSRQTVKGLSPLDDPDAVVMAWMDREEILFRTLERHIVAERLKSGFAEDVDAFMSFSLSVQNRRKARAGSALENHLEVIFTEKKIRYSRGQITENRSRPDFIFPGINEYRNPKFPGPRLTMLGAKTTCKDRWRQVLTEAARIDEKYLLTLEPGISENQTAEMQSENLRLVVPAKIHETYTPDQQRWLMRVSDFIALARDKQQALA